MVDTDARLMARALWHAERGRASTTPNPVVGAVIVDARGVVVGVGHHQRAGGPHAEIVALQAAGAAARGATLYCTLEPCSHYGRTGPCCVAVADAGIARAVVAMRDPFPQVAGRGLAYLQAHGVAVTLGVHEAAARRQNAPYLHAVELGRPWVHLKVALSADGAVASRRGSRTPISGPEAGRWTQRLRASVDAIAVGVDTALIDDPVLTARDVFRHRPLTRVVFDRGVRLPPTARMVQAIEDGPVMVVTRHDAAKREAATHLRDRGVEIIGTDGTVADGLRGLAARGVQSLLVEGGPVLHRALWEAGVVDRVSAIVSEATLGPDAVPWDVPVPLHEWNPRTLALGRDTLLDVDVHRPD